MLSRTLKMTFWVTYDHLGKLIVANLIWALAVLIPGLIGVTAFMTGVRGIALIAGVPALLLACGIAMPITTAGLAYMAKELIDTRDGSVKDLFHGMRLYWRRAVGVGAFYTLAPMCLAVSVWFYAAKLRDTAPWLGYGISALALWCFVFVGLMGMFVMPALVQKKAGVGETLKLSALLVLDNPAFCLGLAIQFVVLIALSIVVVPVLVFLSGSVAVVLASSAYEMLARKYARLAAMETASSEGGIRAVTRKNGGPAGAADDEQDDYLNRGLRDFLFPWKG